MSESTQLDASQLDGATEPDTIQPDAECAAAVELALAAAREMSPGQVGDHLGVQADAGTSVTHHIQALLPGYAQWFWAVTVGRAPGFAPTVAEIVLLPGAKAVLAQPWVPWSERLQPGDLSPGDLLPARPDDDRLVPGYLLSDDPAEAEVAYEIGLGRERVLSYDGRLDAAQRWYSGDRGPGAPMALQAPALCGSCGFLVPLAGSLQAAFGVCANEITEVDGQVVALDYGCGAHSEAGTQNQGHEHTLVERGQVLDDEDIVIVDHDVFVGMQDVAADPASAEAAQPIMPADEGQAEQAEQRAGETGPQPDPVVVAAEPGPAGQQGEETDAEHGSAPANHGDGIDAERDGIDAEGDGVHAERAGIPAEWF